MWCISVAFLLVSGISIAAGAGDKTAYLEHRSALKNYCCGTPKPRVMELEEILDKETLDEFTNSGLKEKLRPQVTVLHRCESTGYCEDPFQRCMPSVTENVTLVFRYLDKTMHYLEVVAENHTECKCGKIGTSYIK